MDDVIGFLARINLMEFGSWASILGLMISVITFIVVFTIKKQFMFRSRVDEYSDSLGEIASGIVALLNSFSQNTDVVYNEFAIADVKLRSIEKGASDNLLSDVKSARKRIRFYRWQHRSIIKRIKPNEKSARLVCTELNVVLQELHNVRKELLVGK